MSITVMKLMTPPARKTGHLPSEAGEANVAFAFVAGFTGFCYHRTNVR